MTNQEAIKILGELKKCYLGGIVDAIDMAIEALKAQEPRVIKNLAGNGICPGCGHVIPAWSSPNIIPVWSSPNYCGYCGQAVKLG